MKVGVISIHFERLEDRFTTRMKLSVLLILTLALPVFPRCPSIVTIDVGDRVIARWTDNLYYPGKVTEPSPCNGEIHVLFDDGDRISHLTTDVSAVILDKPPTKIELGQHVVATWEGGKKYYIGFVTDIRTGSHKFKVTFDDNDEDFYAMAQLRIFSDHSSAHEVGSRVFARWTNGLYYRGFVTSTTQGTVFVNYDDRDTSPRPFGSLKSDPTAVILDAKLPCYADVIPGQRVIAFWPGRQRYYPGTVRSKADTGSTDCYQKAVYNVDFDDGDKRLQDFHQIRIVPCFAH